MPSTVTFLPSFSPLAPFTCVLVCVFCSPFLLLLPPPPRTLVINFGRMTCLSRTPAIVIEKEADPHALVHHAVAHCPHAPVAVPLAPPLLRPPPTHFTLSSLRLLSVAVAVWMDGARAELSTTPEA